MMSKSRFTCVYICLHLFTVLDTLHILHVLHMKQVLIRAPSKLDPARTYPTYKSEESLLRATFRRLDREAQNLLREFTKCKSCSKMFKAHCNIPIHSLRQSLVRDWQGATSKELIGSEWSIHSQDSMTSIISYTFLHSKYGPSYSKKFAGLRMVLKCILRICVQISPDQQLVYSLEALVLDLVDVAGHKTLRDSCFSFASGKRPCQP